MHKVIADLIQKSALASFRVVPRPHSFAESMAVFGQIQQITTQNNGRILHYRQDICPVTKERLEDLDVLLLDADPTETRDMAVAQGERVSSSLSTLENGLLSAFKQHDRVKLVRVTRDPAEIEKRLGVCK